MSEKEQEQEKKPVKKKKEICSGSFRIVISGRIWNPCISDDFESVEYLPAKSADQQL